MKETQDKYEFRVRWQPFLLRADLPEEGIPKPPDKMVVPRPLPHFVTQGKQFGIDFTFKCPRYPNTIKSHALLEFAKEKGDFDKQNEISEKIFQSYFTNGIYLDTDALVSIAEEVGFQPAEVKEYINKEEVRENVLKQYKSWSSKGVSGVPHFFMNGYSTFSGAQDPRSFIKMFERVAELQS